MIPSSTARPAAGLVLAVAVSLLAACAGAPEPLPDADGARDALLAQRLQELVMTDALLQPDHGPDPRPGDWRFVYRQDLRVGEGGPCELRYRMTLDAAREGLGRPRLLDCSGRGTTRRCSTVALPMDRLRDVSIHPRPTSREDQPDAWWFTLRFAGAGADSPDAAWTLEHAFLTTSESRHLLLEETVTGLARACDAPL